MSADLWKIEREFAEQGYACICGTDEAGRGPLAGRVYAAAVILPPELEIPGLDDSKKLTEKKRDKLLDVICENALSYSIAFSSPEEIDEINILAASMLAMRRAVEGLTVSPDLVLVDGNRDPEPTYRGARIESRAIVKGDALCRSIAAASILAKVSRDRYMLEMDALYPGYGFAKHKGYPTREHYEALARLGPSPIHRRSFRLA
ncbi:MAG: ribonuclease HII [Oscillospiraceae bacterium]|nr:ribonuclease HII [Oscillospiraceae bacterium]